MTTLTKAALLEMAKPTVVEVDVDGFGKVWLRSCPELQRSRRIAMLFDANGNLRERHKELRRMHMIIDQVMSDENTPMFVEKDIDELGGLDSSKLDTLVAAITRFNEGDEKKDKAGSNGTSKS